MTVLEGILLIIVIWFTYYYFTSFVEVKRSLVDKLVIDISVLKKLVLYLIAITLLILIAFAPLMGAVTDSTNKDYLGSLVGSFIAVIGAVVAAVITVNLSKKNDEIKDFPKKYAKLRMLIISTERYSISVSPIIFEPEILENSDEHVLNKLEEFNLFYSQTLDELTHINKDMSLKFIDLFDQEIELASSILTYYSGKNRISLYSNVYSYYEMFKTDEAKQLINKGEKMIQDDPDDTQYRKISGTMLYLIFFPVVHKKLRAFSKELNGLNKSMRKEFN